jgi:hypothetical protein
MKVFVQFDAAGSIHSVVTLEAPEGVTVMREPEPGLLVAEAEGAELQQAAGDVEKIRELVKTYRVATPAGPRCRLARA